MWWLWPTSLYCLPFTYAICMVVSSSSSMVLQMMMMIMTVEVVILYRICLFCFGYSLLIFLQVSKQNKSFKIRTKSYKDYSQRTSKNDFLRSDLPKLRKLNSNWAFWPTSGTSIHPHGSMTRWEPDEWKPAKTNELLSDSDMSS